MELKDTYTKIAEDWHRDHQNDDWWIEGTEKFITLLKPGAHVLDAGCGAGNKSAYLATRSFAVTGIDFSEGLIAIAKREVPSVTFLIKDMREIQDLPLYDGILAQASLLHIPRAEIVSTLSVLVSHLETGGYLYAAVKGARADKPLEEIKQEHDYGYSYERFFSYYTLEELRDYYKEVGLEVAYETSSVVGKTEWIQVIGTKV
jgi:trans-aconitate methyltransferase